MNFHILEINSVKSDLIVGREEKFCAGVAIKGCFLKCLQTRTEK